MKFSRRTNWDLAENDLALAIRALRDAGAKLLDLTVSNPTGCDFIYDAHNLLAPLHDPAALLYGPSPLGMLSAREAVALYYHDMQAVIAPDSICLTTSTSEAYSFLFRLLCDAGDKVLAAMPSYPLFDYIAQLDDVALKTYPLLYDSGWHIDLHALDQAITPRTRAVLVVHPNNPTGNFASTAEREALDALCARHSLALIVDEVFLDYPMDGIDAQSFLAGQSTALTFVLSGLSKVCGLPQIKVSWIAVRGPEENVQAAMGRLEVIADTFLSLNTPAQVALPHWLAGRGSFQEQLHQRVEQNLALLDARVQGTKANRLQLQGGWTAILRVPRHVAGVEFVHAALACGVIAQPGEFYGLPEGRIVLSLLTPTKIWEQGLALLPID